jgi:hypothetical protein
MSVAVAIASVADERNTWTAGDKYYAEGTVTISASPATYTTGGIVFNLFIPLIKATRIPLNVTVQGRGAGAGGTLFEYRYIPGTDSSNGLLKIFSGGAGAAAGLAEFTNAAAIPADVSGDFIKYIAIFNGML